MIEELVRKLDVDEILSEISQGKTHVRDVEKAIEKIRKEVLREFYEGKIDIYRFSAINTGLNYVSECISKEFHDFSDKFKVTTIPRDEHIYYSSF